MTSASRYNLALFNDLLRIRRYVRKNSVTDAIRAARYAGNIRRRSGVLPHSPRRKAKIMGPRMVLGPTSHRRLDVGDYPFAAGIDSRSFLGRSVVSSLRAFS